MKVTVYIDVLIITNIIINYFILKIISEISCTYPSSKRMIISSIIGALFSVIIFFNMNFIVAFLLKIFSVIVSVIIAFGFRNKKYFLKMLFYSIFVYMAFTGIVIFFEQNQRVFYINNFCVYMNINPILLVVCIVIVYFCISIFETVVYSREKEVMHNIGIYINGNVIQGTALYDTGFRLKDILGNKNLLLCDFSFISDKLEKNLCESISLFFLENTIEDKRITPIFYSDISKDGMLPAIKPDKVICTDTNKEIENTLIVITNKKMKGEVNLLFGKEIFNMIGE